MLIRKKGTNNTKLKANKKSYSKTNEASSNTKNKVKSTNIFMVG